MHAKTQTYPLVSSRDIADNKKKVFKTTRLGLNRPNLSFYVNFINPNFTRHSSGVIGDLY